MTTPNEGPEVTENKLGDFHLSELPKYLLRYLYDVIDLKKGVDPEKTSDDILAQSSLSGANAWMLMCSIVIASIGLTQDSQAVIIGAMLISPLMSPILGIGLSIGINDTDALWNSLIQFVLSFTIAILTSYIYFELTPIKEFTPQMAARTEPTFLDIFVAIFGGLAGIISIARKDISTTLPGVAIATALMPPLCVTGYGLAAGDFRVASYSFYLFFLNSFFVALATYAIVQYLQFPHRKILDAKTRKKNLLYMVLFSLALVIPSFLIFNQLLKKQNLENNLNSFLEMCIEDETRHLDGHKLVGNILTIRVYGQPIQEDQRALYERCLYDHGLDEYELHVISTSEVGLDDVRFLSDKVEILAAQMEQYKANYTLQQERITKYESTLIDSIDMVEIRDELKLLYPNIIELGLANTYITDFEDQVSTVPTLLIDWKVSPNNRVVQNQLTIIESYVKSRLALDSLKLVAY